MPANQTSTTDQTNLINLFKEQLENESTKLGERYGDTKRGNLLIFWYFMRLYRLESADIEQIIVDGGGELGIDVVYIDENEIVHFYQFKNPKNWKSNFPQPKQIKSYQDCI